MQKTAIQKYNVIGQAAGLGDVMGRHDQPCTIGFFIHQNGFDVFGGAAV